MNGEKETLPVECNRHLIKKKAFNSNEELGVLFDIALFE